MTEQEAIENLKHLFSEYELDLPNTDSLETLQLAISALEKQTAKKVKLIGYHVGIGTKLGSCPNCDGRPLRECDNKYCPDCGQKLDWSEI